MYLNSDLACRHRSSPIMAATLAELRLSPPPGEGSDAPGVAINGSAKMSIRGKWRGNVAKSRLLASDSLLTKPAYRE
jgi:hypothetical protein